MIFFPDESGWWTVRAGNRQGFFPAVYLREVWIECWNYLAAKLYFYQGLHPRLVTLESRLATFQTWPPAFSQQPEELAKAGFFYSGLSDNVACFHCGGGLWKWKEGDIPKEEHAKFYPNCAFLQLISTHEVKQDKVDNGQGNPEVIRFYISSDLLTRESYFFFLLLPVPKWGRGGELCPIQLEQFSNTTTNDSKWQH